LGIVNPELIDPVFPDSYQLVTGDVLVEKNPEASVLQGIYGFSKLD
jgi:hypothetical protein